MILLDYNGIAISNIMAQRLGENEDMIRHMILNTIRMYKHKFRGHGDIVIVTDAGGNWRKDVFPEYKANRKKTRDASSVDWERLFEITNMVFDEITENFPYRTMKVWGTEADDCIAQICIGTQEFGAYEDIMIVSADKDFAQLQKYKNVKQYSPMTKKFIHEEDPRGFLLEHILKGDTSDGVPNVLSDDKVFVEGRRQGVMSAKKKAILSEDINAMGEEVVRNFQRNERMIDLTKCPDKLVIDIKEHFNKQAPRANKGKVFPYLVNKQCRRLLEVVEEFF
tara:strand:- start:22 stop:861 length:840 start_codon:yes stop_codon:yes gene_type:complete